MIQAIIMAITGICMAVGGYNVLLVRRLGIPLLLCGYALFVTRGLWCLTMLSAYGALSMGYGDNSIFRHIFGDGWGRGVWAIVVGLTLSLALAITGHLAIWQIVVYLVACFFSEPLFKNLWQVAGDILIGCVFGSIVFFIH